MSKSPMGYYVENLYDACDKPKGEAVFYSPAGNSDADVIMLVTPMKADFHAGSILASEHAERFFDLLRICGFDPKNDFLYLPVARYGMKIHRAATKDSLEILKKVLKKRPYTLVVCLGGAAYSHVFTSGLKAKSYTIFGNLVYVPQWLGKVPMTVLPDIEPLIQPKTEETAWKIQRQEQEYAQTFCNFLRKLRKTMDTRSPV